MTFVPEIKFYTSTVYERVWWDFRLTKPSKIDSEIFQKNVIEIRSRKNLFQEYLREITRLLKITWNRREIEVWMVSLNIGCFSRPLTLSFCQRNGRVRDIDNIIDVLTHELIHNALIEHPQYAKAIQLLEKDYSTESFLMHVHTLVHAVHAIIYKTKRGENRMEWDLEYTRNNQPYAKAWEVVQKEGAENILKKYLNVEVNQ